MFAPHYARPVTRRMGADADVFDGPSETATRLYTLAAGEEFALLDITGGWGWGYRRSDHRVGYVQASLLG